MSIVTNKLGTKWSFYIHLHNVSDWTFESYHKIMEINSVEDAILINDKIDIELIKKTIIFVMKDNIKPMWEDENNKNGGGFSFKVHNKTVEQVWKKIYYRLIGDSLTTNTQVSKNICGISLSPKKSFCIIKIWMKDCKFINPVVFFPIDDAMKTECLFKKHISEF
jgi:hypothetical protein